MWKSRIFSNRSFAIGLMLAAFSTYSLPARGQIAVTDEVNNKTSAPLFSGKITMANVDEFISRYQDISIDRLVILSPGGDGEAGIKLGNWVLDRNLDVEVRILCMSACANFVFTAGKKKIIGPGAVVIWHGSMELKDIREHQARYESLAQQDQGALTPEEKTFLQDENFSYKAIRRLRELQSDFFARVGVDEYVTRLGQEPVRYGSDGWTATLNLMNRMGIKDIIASNEYGSRSYVDKNIVAKFENKGKLLIFGLSPTGSIVPLE